MRLRLILFLNMQLLILVLVAAAPVSATAETDDYKLQPGDILLISVWKEEDLQSEVLIRPDGKFSFPLAGDLDAKGQTVLQVQGAIAERIEKYVPDPVVTVQVRQILGNKVYVIGKVNRPGEFPLVHDMDVMQALSVAGGMATFASANKIRILRRSVGALSAIVFNYGDIEDGENLDQNIMLQPGDVVVVP